MADTTLILGLGGLVFTLGGTVAGAAIGARTTSAVEDRRERRREREQAAATRMAARLIRADLAISSANLAWASLRETWHPVKVRLPLTAWREHGGQLALGLEDVHAWDKVYRAHTALDHLREGSLALLDPGQKLDAGMLESLRELNGFVVDADSVLLPLTGHPPGQGEDPTPPPHSDQAIRP